VLLPEPLRQASVPYHSLALGKWHLADRVQLDADPLHPLGSPTGRWFDGWAGTLFTSPTPEGFDPAVYGYSIWKKSFAGYVNTRATPCSPSAPPCTALTIAPPMLNYATADTAEDAIQCLRDSSGPLFLYVAFNAIHTPLHDTPAGLPQPACPQYTPPTIPCDFSSQLPLNPARARCMLEALDAQIGRLLCEIDFNDTTVILIGDNGTAKKSTFAPYKPSHAKTTMYEGGLRVPLIVRSPVIPAATRGSMQTAPVHCVDLYATVCELAGVATPPSAADSVSIVPYLEGSNTALRSYVYSEDFFPHFTPDPTTHAAPAAYGAKHHSQAICDGRFKLIRISRRNTPAPPVVTERFFDLLEGGPPVGATATPDYFEQNDLLLSGNLSSAAAGALAALRATLDTDFPYLTR
jgi:arylsulfatase A-like enzyme